MVRRWQQLPLDHALSCVPDVRALLVDLAGEDAPLLPDLGPGALMDQLTVLVHDACAQDAVDAAELSTRLRDLLAALG
ncbi:MAG: hypothetical protein WB473_04545 [Pedococcus sp.]